MSSPIYKAHRAPRITLLDGNNTDVTARGVVGIDYDNQNSIEYTTFGLTKFFDGYTVEETNPKFITGTIVDITVENTTPPRLYCKSISYYFT